MALSSIFEKMVDVRNDDVIEFFIWSMERRTKKIDVFENIFIYIYQYSTIFINQRALQ